MKTSQQTIKKAITILFVGSASLIIVALLFFIATENREHLFQHEYTRGHRDALKHQEFEVGASQDTIIVYHDGVKYSLIVTNDTLRVDIDFVRISELPKEQP